ncbi:DNA-directed RNA polymerase core subunit rpc10 [Elasticomyces elasticus]|nr:DNA-directed RNA polymerase core subunit rpc10 [Elasticomyces elasticus]
MTTRETYIPPTLTQSTQQSASQTQTQTHQTQPPYHPATLIDTNAYDAGAKPVSYKCGDCNTDVTLKKGDPIRCKECGYRVLYKKRTNRMIQFEAR